MKIPIRPHKGKSVKPYAPLRRYPVIELPDTAAAEISGIFVFRLLVFNFPVDLRKSTVCDDRLAPQDQFPLIGNIEGKIAKHPGVACDYFPHLAVASRYRLLQGAFPVCQHNGQPVQFPREKPFLPVQPVSKLLPVLRLSQGQHGRLMPFFWQLIHRLVTHLYRGAVRQRHTKVSLQPCQLVIESVVLEIRHNLLIFGIIGLRSLI